MVWLVVVGAVVSDTVPGPVEAVTFDVLPPELPLSVAEVVCWSSPQPASASASTAPRFRQFREVLIMDGIVAQLRRRRRRPGAGP